MLRISPRESQARLKTAEGSAQIGRFADLTAKLCGLMPAVVTIRTSSGEALCQTCVVADTPRLRLRGLLGRDALAPTAGLLLRPAAAIHTCGMRFAIDVVFLSRERRVLRVAAEVPAWRLVTQRGARSVLELPAGTAAQLGLCPGDVLTWRPALSRRRRVRRTSA